MLACTFTPLKRNRYRCNHPKCRDGDGRPIILKKASLATHSANAYQRRNPRHVPFEHRQKQRRDSKVTLKVGYIGRVGNCTCGQRYHLSRLDRREEFKCECGRTVVLEEGF
ncbi:MAG TPA: hypothetical protein VHD38_01225 [Candidatus Paceibacterota bacterium]|jgi:hypothetical protein|nr:hypothetical protein [Candidatus Paceibacterota bacterium]